jgi:alpha-N-arabinofuranosidase
MYSVHQDAQLLTTEFTNTQYHYNNEIIPQLSVSSSMDSEDNIHISVCNLDPNSEVEIDCNIVGASVHEVTGKIVTAELINSYNTFEEPDYVVEKSFHNAVVTENHLIAKLPPKSVVVLEVK